MTCAGSLSASTDGAARRASTAVMTYSRPPRCKASYSRTARSKKEARHAARRPGPPRCKASFSGKPVPRRGSDRRREDRGQTQSFSNYSFPATREDRGQTQSPFLNGHRSTGCTAVHPAHFPGGVPALPESPSSKKREVRIQTNKQNHLVWFCSTFYGFTHMLPTFPSLISLPYFV